MSLNQTQFGRDQNRLIARLNFELGEDIGHMKLHGGEADFEAFKRSNSLDIPYYFGDEKVLKTIGRVNPTLWILKNGIVKGKWSGYALPSINTIENAFDAK